jgi:hypothetical protein
MGFHVHIHRVDAAGLDDARAATFVPKGEGPSEGPWDWSCSS